MYFSNNKKNKFHAETLSIDGKKFSSKKEYNRYLELRMMERAGLIKDLKEQVKYELIPARKKEDGKTERAACYIADFVYFDNEKNKTIVEDVKGLKAGAAYQIFVLKRKMMLDKYGIEILET